MSKIVLGITTYNRSSILEKSIISLRNSNLPDNCVIRVYDDYSKEFSADDLKKLIPEVALINVQKSNVGSDCNIWTMYNNFVKTYQSGDILINCDSDLIYSENWIQNALPLFDKTDGVMSVFNSPTHGIEGSDQGELIEKKDIGSAGTVFSWEVLNKIIEKFNEPFHGSFDYAWCRYLRENGIRILCTKKSLVQHIGIVGYNSDLSKFDYGMEFDVSTLKNGQVINDILEDISKNQVDIKRRFWYALFPFERVKSGEKIVIYGAGDVARDYLQQVYLNGYCNVVAVIDGKRAGTTIVVSDECKIVAKSPDFLKETDLYDKIVLGVREAETARSIKKDISNLNKGLIDKVVFAGEGRVLHL